MPLPVIANTLRVAIEGHLSNGHSWANVLHFRKTGVLTYAGAIAILDPILDAHLATSAGAGASWASLADNLSSVEQIRYTPLDGTTATVVESHVIPGAESAHALPANVALVITLRTGVRGRSFRGRVYQAPFVEAYNDDDGGPSSVLVAAVQAQWEELLAALVGSGLTLVVASYELVVATDVASVTVDGRWDTQRRRLNT